MLYDVEKAAIKLNISKQSIYNKIKLNEFKSRVVKKQGKTYIDEDLLKLIQDSLKFNSSFKEDIKPKDIEEDPTLTPQAQEDILKFNQELISALLDQLKEKDKQIHELHKLLENSQVLLKDKPQQDILLLENHFQAMDLKLTNIREQMKQRKEDQQHKGIFKKIFKK